MIAINLLPYGLRRSRKKKLLPGGLNIPMEVIIGSGGGLIMLLIGVHVVLLLISGIKLSQYKSLKKQWEESLPNKEKTDSVLQEMRSLSAKSKNIEGIIKEGTIHWSKKLNIISDSLPRGVWLKKVAFDGETLFIEGSAISRRNEEMINVHNFTSNLQSNKDFLEGFSDLELGSIQGRKIVKIDVADFLITSEVQ